MKYHTADWQNARQLHTENPDTFNWEEPPADFEFHKGDGLKICNGKERFWTSFVKEKNNKIIAKVNNELIWNYPYKYGSYVAFTRDNIYDFYPKKEEADIKRKFFEALKPPQGALNNS
jgi:hypothetical protein